MGHLFKNIGFALLLLVAVLVMVNIFVILPLMHIKPETTAYIQDEPVERTKPAAVITTDTLTIIKKTGGDEGDIYMDSKKKSSRNPFFWPGEKRQQKTVAQKNTPQDAPPEVERPKPQLSMVIVGKDRKQALLDNAFVREGEMFHGYLVKRIADEKVVLSDELGEFNIYLASIDETDDQSQPPGGLIEK